MEIIEAEVCPDPEHMLVSIPPKLSVSGFMGYIKGKSRVLIYQKYANMKFKYRNRKLWCRGYYVDTVGKNKKVIAEYIANQLKEDKAMEQMTVFEMIYSRHDIRFAIGKLGYSTISCRLSKRVLPVI